MNEQIPINLIPALLTRKQCQGNIYLSAEEATKMHLDLVAEACYTPDDINKAIEEERHLLELGNQYFAQGYRLHQSSRHIYGTSYTVPPNAICYDIYDAGYIAMSPAFRVYYVTKGKSDE